MSYSYKNDKLNLEVSIRRRKNNIKQINEWCADSLKKSQKDLKELLKMLKWEIEKEDEYHMIIAKKLDQIAALKQQIAEVIPETNGFTFEHPV